MARVEMTEEQKKKLSKLNKEYPCDKRDGWATKGCSCDTGPQIDTTRVKCRYYGGSTKVKNCKDCPHQKAYKKFLDRS